MLKFPPDSALHFHLEYSRQSSHERTVPSKVSGAVLLEEFCVFCTCFFHFLYLFLPFSGRKWSKIFAKFIMDKQHFVKCFAYNVNLQPNVALAPSQQIFTLSKVDPHACTFCRHENLCSCVRIAVTSAKSGCNLQCNICCRTS